MSPIAIKQGQQLILQKTVENIGKWLPTKKTISHWKKLIRGETDSYRHYLFLTGQYNELSRYANPNIKIFALKCVKDELDLCRTCTDPRVICSQTLHRIHRTSREHLLQKSTTSCEKR